MSEGEPLDYVIGWSEFLGCRIDLSERPLIPRPETEGWTDALIQKLKIKNQNAGRRLRVLDIFAGSGCIGIAVLRHVPNAHVCFVDIDPSCIRQIEQNCSLNQIESSRYRIMQADMFAFEDIGSVDRIIANKIRSYVICKFDVIVANPPYVAEATVGERVARSTLDYEPHQALFGGPDGLRYIRALLRNAHRFLTPAGELWMEFDDTQAGAVQDLLSHSELYGHLERDHYGRLRYLVAAKR